MQAKIFISFIFLSLGLTLTEQSWGQTFPRLLSVFNPYLIKGKSHNFLKIPPSLDRLKRVNHLVKEVQLAQPPLLAITSLKTGDTIPLEVLIEHKPISIARSIVWRKYLIDEESKQCPNGLNFYQNSKIHLAFDEILIEKILRTGQFLNQFQTGESKGMYWPEWRSRVENNMAGLKFDGNPTKDLEITQKINLIRPKYAYMALTENVGIINLDRLEIYGKITAVLHDTIKFRSTFTTQDSLNFVNAPKDASTFHRRFHEVPRTIYEVQVWGPVTLKEDVQYFLVPEDTDQEIIKKLMEVKIPIYHQSSNKLTHYRGKMLFDGINLIKE